MSYKCTATQVNTILHSHFYLDKVKYFKDILQEKKTSPTVNWLDHKKWTLQYIVVWSQVWTKSGTGFMQDLWIKLFILR